MINRRIKLKYEIYYIISSIIFSVGIIFLVDMFHPTFPYLFNNILLVFLGLYLLRIVFAFQSHLAYNLKWVRFAMIFLPIWSMVFAFKSLSVIVIYLDINGMKDVLLFDDIALGKFGYQFIRSEYIFFGLMTILCSLIIPFKMIGYIYRDYRKTLKI